MSSSREEPQNLCADAGPNSPRSHAAEPKLANLRSLLAAWLCPAEVVSQLRRERDHHKAVAERRWEDVYLMRAGPADGGFEMVMRHPMSAIITEHLARMLESVGAENWVAEDVFHKKHGALTLTVQRKRGKSPNDTIAELKAELEAARDGTHVALQVDKNRWRA